MAMQGDIMVGSVKNMVDRLSKDFTAQKPAFEPRRPTLMSKTSSGSQGNHQVVVTFAYHATQADELNLAVGEVVEVLEEVEDGWSRGRILRTGEQGMFPTNFVETKALSATSAPAAVVLRPVGSMEKLDEKPGATNIIGPEASRRVPSVIGPMSGAAATSKEKEEPKTKEMARVKFVYEPQHPDELRLAEIGSLITIIRKDCGDAGWFEGELNGKRGLFPDNFVEVVQVPVVTSSPSLNRTSKPLKPPMQTPNTFQPVVPPAVPAKPKPGKLSDSQQSLNGAAPAVPSSASKPTVNSNFAALRDQVAKNLTSRQPGDPPVMTKSTIVSSMADGSSAAGARPMSTIETRSDELNEEPQQLVHVTKDRPRGPGKRPNSVMIGRSRESTENLLDKPNVSHSPAVSSQTSHVETKPLSPTTTTAAGSSDMFGNSRTSTMAASALRPPAADVQTNKPEFLRHELKHHEPKKDDSNTLSHKKEDHREEHKTVTSTNVALSSHSQNAHANSVARSRAASGEWVSRREFDDTVARLEAKIHALELRLAEHR